MSIIVNKLFKNTAIVLAVFAFFAFVVPQAAFAAPAPSVTFDSPTKNANVEFTLSGLVDFTNYSVTASATGETDVTNSQFISDGSTSTVITLSLTAGTWSIVASEQTGNTSTAQTLVVNPVLEPILEVEIHDDSGNVLTTDATSGAKIKPGYDVYVTYIADGPIVDNGNATTSALGDETYFTLFYDADKLDFEQYQRPNGTDFALDTIIYKQDSSLTGVTTFEDTTLVGYEHYNYNLPRSTDGNESNTEKDAYDRDIYDSSVDSKVIVNAPTTLFYGPAYISGSTEVNYCRYQYDLNLIDFGSSSPLTAAGTGSNADFDGFDCVGYRHQRGQSSGVGNIAFPGTGRSFTGDDAVTIGKVKFTVPSGLLDGNFDLIATATVRSDNQTTFPNFITPTSNIENIFTFSVDSTSPTVTETALVDSAEPKSGEFDVKVTFDETVENVDIADFRFVETGTDIIPGTTTISNVEAFDSSDVSQGSTTDATTVSGDYFIVSVSPSSQLKTGSTATSYSFEVVVDAITGITDEVGNPFAISTETDPKDKLVVGVDTTLDISNVSFTDLTDLTVDGATVSGTKSDTVSVSFDVVPVDGTLAIAGSSRSTATDTLCQAITLSKTTITSAADTVTLGTSASPIAEGSYDCAFSYTANSQTKSVDISPFFVDRTGPVITLTGTTGASIYTSGTGYDGTDGYVSKAEHTTANALALTQSVAAAGSVVSSSVDTLSNGTAFVVPEIAKVVSSTDCDDSSVTYASGLTYADLDADVEYKICFKVTDGLGNETYTSHAKTIIRDTVLPTVSSFDLAADDDTGSSDSDNITNQAGDLSFSGTNSEEASVSIFYQKGTATPVDTSLSGNTATSTNGAWTIGNVDFSLVANFNEITNVYAVLTDVAGNTNDPSETSSYFAITIDTGAPGAPTISAPTADSYVNTTPRFTGTSESDAEIIVSVGGTEIGTTTADAAGAWDITVANVNGVSGSNVFSVTQTDVAGNSSSASTITLVVDSEANAPTIVTPITTPTNDSTPDIVINVDEAGTATFGGPGNCLSSTAAVSVGNNTITFGTLLHGQYENCTVTLTDNGNNLSATTTIPTFIIDIVAEGPTEDTVVSTPTRDTTPDVVLSSTESGTISFSNGCGTSTDLAITAGTPKTFTLTQTDDTTGLADNTYTCTATLTDALGNTNDLTLTQFVVDTNVVDLVETTPVSNPTNDPVVKITIDEPGTLKFAGDCVSLADATYGSSGLKTISLTGLGEAVYASCDVTLQDIAGNTSNILTLSEFEVDLTGPSITFPDLEASSDTGYDNSDDITSEKEFVLTGTINNAITAKIFYKLTTASTYTSADATVDLNAGTYSFTMPSGLVDGTYEVYAEAKDEADNPESSVSINITLETVAPATSTVTLDTASDTGSSNTDKITSDETPTINTTVSAGQGLYSIQVLDNGAVVKTDLYDSTNQPTAYSTDVPTLSDGDHDIALLYTDVAGNETTTSALSITIDTTAPAFSVSADDPDNSPAGTVTASTTKLTITLENLIEASKFVWSYESLVDTSPATVLSANSITTHIDVPSSGELVIANGVSLSNTPVTPPLSSTVTLTDIAGNSTTIDLITGPRLVVSYGTTPAQTRVVSLNADFDIYKLELDDVSLCNVTNGASLSFGNTPFVSAVGDPGVADGTDTYTSEGDNGKSICYRVTGLNGESTYVGVTITGIDTDAPTLTINDIAGDNIVNASEKLSSLVISGVSDAEVGQVVSIDFGGVFDPVLTTNVLASGTYTLTVTASQIASIVDRIYGIIVSVDDLAGNETIVSKNITFDIVGPTISITRNTQNRVQSATYTTSATDAGSGVQESNVLYYSTSVTQATGCNSTLAWTGGTYTQTSSVTFNDESDNTKFVCAQATDDGGNESYETLLIENIDTTAPTNFAFSGSTPSLSSVKTGNDLDSFDVTIGNINDDESVSITGSDCGNTTFTVTGGAGDSGSRTYSVEGRPSSTGTFSSCELTFLDEAGNESVSTLTIDFAVTSSSSGGVFGGGGGSSAPVAFAPSNPLSTGYTAPQETQGPTLNQPFPTETTQQGSGYTTPIRSHLRAGDVGDDVKNLQKYLNGQGFTVSHTGAGSPGNESNYFGPATERAVKAYQEHHKEEILHPVGLTSATGYAGPSTISHINDRIAQQASINVTSGSSSSSTSSSSGGISRNLRVGDVGNDVKNLQKYLNAQGFTVSQAGAGSPGNESNFFGPATERAVKAYQEHHKTDILNPLGLTSATGYAGPSTISHINKNIAPQTNTGSSTQPTSDSQTNTNQLLNQLIDILRSRGIDTQSLFNSSAPTTPYTGQPQSSQSEFTAPSQFGSQTATQEPERQTGFQYPTPSTGSFVAPVSNTFSDVLTDGVQLQAPSNPFGF